MSRLTRWCTYAVALVTLPSVAATVGLLSLRGRGHILEHHASGMMAHFAVVR
jgi:hypothetical protein